MIKLHFVLRRKKGMSLEDFQKYWKENHGPLVAKNAKALGIQRYLQSHSFPGQENSPMTQERGGMEPLYDGVAELWWASHEAMAAAGQTAEGRAAAQELLEDERNFIDFSRSTMWLAEEHVVVG